MREVSPALGLKATEAANSENKLGIQIGVPVGHMRPPRVYLSHFEFPNAGIAGAVTKIMEGSGIAEAWEVSKSDNQMEKKLAEKAAEYVQNFLDGFNPDNGGTLFLSGNEEMAENVLSRVNIPSDITVKINQGDLEYIPDPAS